MKAVLRWSAVAAYAAAIFVVSGMEKLPSAASAPGLDKAFHAVVYFIFAGITYRALSPGKSSTKAAAVAALIAALYGATDEFHQSFVAGRTASFIDWAADAAGGVLWMAWAWLAGRATPRHRRRGP